MNGLTLELGSGEGPELVKKNMERKNVTSLQGEVFWTLPPNFQDQTVLEVMKQEEGGTKAGLEAGQAELGGASSDSAPSPSSPDT